MSTYDPTSTEGLAEHASERLQMNARGLFTSDLSVNEYLCVEKAGFEPVGLVVGSSIYHIGFQQSSWKASQEMGVLTQAMYSARELAMTRMEEEADQLGADGIVGVRLDVGPLRVGYCYGGVHRDRHGDQAQGRQGSSRSERAPVYQRSVRAGVLDPDADR
jgi:uncharacterized protein YbjQ (UPF0145 family)